MLKHKSNTNLHLNEMQSLQMKKDSIYLIEVSAISGAFLSCSSSK